MNSTTIKLMSRWLFPHRREMKSRVTGAPVQLVTIEQLPWFLNWAKGTAVKENSIRTLQLGEKVLTSRSLWFLGRNLTTHFFFFFFFAWKEIVSVDNNNNFTWKLKWKNSCKNRCSISGGAKELIPLCQWQLMRKYYRCALPALMGAITFISSIKMFQLCA